MAVNDNNNAWLNQSIPSSSGAGDPFGGYGALIYALGNMGQGMLKGTNQEWLAAPGATAANMASNQLSGNKYQSLIDALSKLTAQTSADPNTPAVGGTNTAFKFSPDGGFVTEVKHGTSYKPETPDMQYRPVPSTAKPEQAIQTSIEKSGIGQLPSALSNPGQLNFPQALLRTRW